MLGSPCRGVEFLGTVTRSWIMRRILRRLLGVHVLRADHDRILDELASVRSDFGALRRLAETQIVFGAERHDRIAGQVQTLQACLGSLGGLVEAQNAPPPVPPVWPVSKWVCTELKGLLIWIDLNDDFIGRTILHDVYEDELVGIVLSHMRPGSTFVDVGTNVGAYSLQMARAVGPTGKVFSFEPRSDTFAMLQRSVRANGFDDRCRLYNKGLGDAAGAGWLHHWTGNQGASFVSEEGQPGGDPIEITTLDDIDFGERVDFFKIDVEGFETKVLKGGRRFFKRYRPPATSEVFPRVLRAVGGSSAEEYLSLWEEYGYEVRLYEDGKAGRVLAPSDLRDETAFPDLFNILCNPR